MNPTDYSLIIGCTTGIILAIIVAVVIVILSKNARQDD